MLIPIRIIPITIGIDTGIHMHMYDELKCTANLLQAQSEIQNDRKLPGIGSRILHAPIEIAAKGVYA